MMRKNKKQYFLCKNDVILAAVYAGIAILLFVLLLVMHGNAQGNIAVVTVDGQIYGTYWLNESRDVRIETENGYNVLHIEEGSISMTEADCPDGYCITRGSIHQNKDTIVCLPHRVVAEIRIQSSDTEESMDYDVVSY